MLDHLASVSMTWLTNMLQEIALAKSPVPVPPRRDCTSPSTFFCSNCMLSKLVLYLHGDVCPRHKLQHELYMFESTRHVAPKSDIFRKTHQLVPRKLSRSVSLIHLVHYPSPWVYECTKITTLTVTYHHPDRHIPFSGSVGDKRRQWLQCGTGCFPSRSKDSNHAGRKAYAQTMGDPAKSP